MRVERCARCSSTGEICHCYISSSDRERGQAGLNERDGTSLPGLSVRSDRMNLNIRHCSCHAYGGVDSRVTCCPTSSFTNLGITLREVIPDGHSGLPSQTVPERPLIPSSQLCYNKPQRVQVEGPSISSWYYSPPEVTMTLTLHEGCGACLPGPTIDTIPPPPIKRTQNDMTVRDES